MDYYNGSYFISDLETKLKEKIEKMEVLKLIESDNIYIQIGAQKMSPDCAATTEDTATRKTIAIDESREWYSETEFLF